MDASITTIRQSHSQFKRIEEQTNRRKDGEWRWTTIRVVRLEQTNVQRTGHEALRPCTKRDQFGTELQ